MRLSVRNYIVASILALGAAAPPSRESGKTFKLGKYVKGTVHRKDRGCEAACR